MKVIIAEVNDNETKVLQGMDTVLDVQDTFFSYELIGVAEVKDEQTDVWEKRDFYEQRTIKKSCIQQVGITWIHKIQQWEVIIDCGSSDSMGLRFAPEHRKDANDLYIKIKDWYLNG